jgi:hypothetical protein
MVDLWLAKRDEEQVGSPSKEVFTHGCSVLKPISHSIRVHLTFMLYSPGNTSSLGRDRRQGSSAKCRFPGSHDSQQSLLAVLASDKESAVRGVVAEHTDRNRS